MAEKQPRGFQQFILGIDCETTGLCFYNQGAKTPVYNESTGERHQAVSWGVLVIDSVTLETVDELYVEIKWNNESKKQRKANPSFGRKAEEIHGLSQEYLEENGVEEEEALCKIAELILKYWGPTGNIQTLGHNVHLFDLEFLKDLFNRHDVELHTGNRHIDALSIGYATFGIFNSDDMFEVVGLSNRGVHNALDDIKRTLKSVRIIRKIFNKALEQ